jgi:hypothetical protein
MKSILDPTFKYTPSGSTDLAKTFARVRREQKKAAEATKDTTVVPIIKKPKGA